MTDTERDTMLVHAIEIPRNHELTGPIPDCACSSCNLHHKYGAERDALKADRDSWQEQAFMHGDTAIRIAGERDEYATELGLRPRWACEECGSMGSFSHVEYPEGDFDVACDACGSVHTNEVAEVLRRLADRVKDERDENASLTKECARRAAECGLLRRERRGWVTDETEALYEDRWLMLEKVDPIAAESVTELLRLRAAEKRGAK